MKTMLFPVVFCVFSLFTSCHVVCSFTTCTSNSLASFSKPKTAPKLLVAPPNSQWQRLQRRQPITKEQFRRWDHSSSSSSRLNLFPELFDGSTVAAFSDMIAQHHTISSSSLILSEGNILRQTLQSIPFGDLGRELSDALDVGAGLSRAVGNIPEKETAVVLESIGFDLLIFLSASVFVTLFSKALNITPILGYLFAGAVLGPHGLDIFANSKADVEIGDFGILFLLFSEGLDVSRERLKQLSSYLPLGMAQISLVTGVITAIILNGIPRMLGEILPLDMSVLPIGTPVQAVVLGLTGSLSTSAFIFPVLKEREWEEEEAGQAATSVLLLQDLMVAPLLVLLPYLVGQSETDYSAIAFLTFKATIGFGAVIYAGSFVLRKLFGLVSQTQSSETFVALCLLVSVGMGVIAKSLGLTDTAGAFAAGVLLANSSYRAQIQADILPFKGILLGIFFMDAGSNFDVDLVQQEWPTIVCGVLGLISIKAATLGLATQVPEAVEPNRLPAADAVRISLLLAGGGEFAFVVLALAEKLKVIPADLGALLTAIVLITMGLTPLLGDAAEKLSEPLLKIKEEGKREGGRDSMMETEELASDAIVVCGYGEVGQSVVRALSSKPGMIRLASGSRAPRHHLVSTVDLAEQQLPYIAAFDTDATLAVSALRPSASSIVLFGNGANSEVIRSSGVERPTCIYVTYENYNKVLSAVSRLRSVYDATIPIFARASTRLEAEALKEAGATEVVVESDELPKCALALQSGTWTDEVAIVASVVSTKDDKGSDGFAGSGSEAKVDDLTNQDLREAAAAAAGVPLSQIRPLLELFKSMDLDGSGTVSAAEVDAVLKRSIYWVASDEEIKMLDDWLESSIGYSLTETHDDDNQKRDEQTLSVLDFCRLVGRAPRNVRKAFGIVRETQS